MCGAELHSLPEGVQRVARALREQGHPHAPRMLDDAARTAQQAADALGIADLQRLTGAPVADVVQQVEGA